MLLSSVVLATPVVKEQTNIQQSGVVADNAVMKNGDVNAHAQGDGKSMAVSFNRKTLTIVSPIQNTPFSTRT